MSRFWPKSLKGQMLLAVALALLFAQAFHAVLLYRAQSERRDATLIHTAAMRLFTATRDDPPGHHRDHGADLDLNQAARGMRLERTTVSPLRSGELRYHDAEQELREILTDQDMNITDVIVTRRLVANDAVAKRRLELRNDLLARREGWKPENLLLAAVLRKGDPEWLVVRVLIPTGERTVLATLIVQTLLIYAAVVGVIALLLRRITRPLAALTERVERFADTRDVGGQIEPEGPDDIRRLIVAHNAMEGRIAAMLDEKDVMLGAIGHDLKTPLAALRVRIESVEDDGERGKMARTIEDITRTLDDILALARVGKSSEPSEVSELSALVASVVEEYEDMGEPVTLAESPRITLPLRATLLRRALRNLIGNALRYGREARVTLASEGRAAVIRIDDDGPGIPDDAIALMMEPFKRGDPSRNSETGGAGLGLTLARAIALQHGGSLVLSNRHDGGALVTGLTATLRLPLG